MIWLVVVADVAENAEQITAAFSVCRKKIKKGDFLSFSLKIFAVVLISKLAFAAFKTLVNVCILNR